MAYTSLLQVPFPPKPMGLFLSPTFSTGAVIDAAGEKIAIIGRVLIPTRVSKDITKVQFRFGTVTKSGGSGLTVSLQDVNAGANPLQPDETQDQTVAVANGDAGFASNTWYTTGALSANRTVNHGDLLAVVIEYDGTGWQSADSVVVNGHGLATALNHWSNQADVMLKTGGTWAPISNAIPNIILEMTDGTFGTLQGSYVASAWNDVAYNTGTNPDERALKFNVPFKCKIDGGWMAGYANVTEHFSFNLYEGTTLRQSVTIDCDQQAVTNNQRFWDFVLTEHEITPNTDYYLSVLPTTANSINLFHCDVSTANHLTVLPGGPNLCLVTRNDGGSWNSPATTSRPLIGAYLSAIDDGAGGGGGTTARVIGG